MRMLVKPLFWFAARLTAWSGLALACVAFTLGLVLRLDVAFFDSHNMIRGPVLRSAFYAQLYQIDPIFFVMLGIGFACVLTVAVVLAKSQLNYFERVTRAFDSFAHKGVMPSASQLGPFSPHVGYFFDVVERRLKHESADKIQSVVNEALVSWPRKPRVTWADQLQFMMLSGALGAFYSVLCLIVYWKITDRVVEFANATVRFTNAAVPEYFFKHQFQTVNMLVWAVLGIVTVNFALAGYRFGSHIAEASYAMLRDLRTFMEGDHEQRLFLRSGYPVHPFVKHINGCLAKVATKLNAGNVISVSAGKRKNRSAA